MKVLVALQQQVMSLQILICVGGAWVLRDPAPGRIVYSLGTVLR